MSIWLKLILSVIHYIPMFFISLALFRVRIKPYRKQIVLGILAGTTVDYVNNSPLMLVSVISVWLMVTWKYRFVPAVLVALSGYVMSVLLTTTVIICVNLMHTGDYREIKDNFMFSAVTRVLILMAKCGFLLALYKLRLGFTFLTHYTRIPFVRENVGVYLFILVTLIGIVYRFSYRENVFSAVMPIQMLSLSVALFVYASLRKEFSLQC